MSKKIEIINGPNINLLGKREPNIYGDLTLESINKEITNYGEELNLETFFFNQILKVKLSIKFRHLIKVMVLLLMLLRLRTLL